MGIRVLCAGTFDHLHKGHIDFLKQAKACGDELYVIIARDENVKRIKGLMPELDEIKRKKDVEDTGIPDNVLLGYSGSDILKIIEELSPDIIALGYDQRVKEEKIQERFPNCKVVRLKPYQPDKYKSSFFRNNSNNSK